MKKYSIIVPIYNIENYLEQCVNSLIGQNRDDTEIILVDDGSTDSSAEICDRFSQLCSCVKVIHKANGGLVSARKAGLKAAAGEYILCVDGDDWISPDYVACFDRIIQQYAPDIVCCGFIQSFPDKNTEHPLPYRTGFYSRNNLEEEIFPILMSSPETGRGFVPSVWAKAFKRSLYEEKQLAVSDVIRIGEDGACTIPCILSADSMYIMPECLYHYRFNQSSMTKEKKPISWIGVEAISDHFSLVIKNRGMNFENQLSRRMQHSLFNVCCSRFYRNDGYAVVCKEIKNELSKEKYKKYILTYPKGCGWKQRFMYTVIKYRLYPVMKVVSLYRR